MDKKALFSLPYGVFMLATKAQDRMNGCITNTCIQVANDPTRIAISVLNKNLTCEMIKESGYFTISLLDQSCTFDTIKFFGFQSGRDVNKFEYLEVPYDDNGIPYMGWAACAVISGKVVESIDLGSHTLFIAEVTDAKMLSDKEPLTYSYYQSNIKPQPQKPAEEKKIVGYKCKICGHVYEGSTLPADYTCPICGHPADDFEPIYA